MKNAADLLGIFFALSLAVVARADGPDFPKLTYPGISSIKDDLALKDEGDSRMLESLRQKSPAERSAAQPHDTAIVKDDHNDPAKLVALPDPAKIHSDMLRLRASVTALLEHRWKTDFFIKNPFQAVREMNDLLSELGDISEAALKAQDVLTQENRYETPAANLVLYRELGLLAAEANSINLELLKRDSKKASKLAQHPYNLERYSKDNHDGLVKIGNWKKYYNNRTGVRYEPVPAPTGLADAEHPYYFDHPDMGAKSDELDKRNKEYGNLGFHHAWQRVFKTNHKSGDYVDDDDWKADNSETELLSRKVENNPFVNSMQSLMPQMDLTTKLYTELKSARQSLSTCAKQLETSKISCSTNFAECEDVFEAHAKLSNRFRKELANYYENDLRNRDHLNPSDDELMAMFPEVAERDGNKLYAALEVAVNQDALNFQGGKAKDPKKQSEFINGHDGPPKTVTTDAALQKFLKKSALESPTRTEAEHQRQWNEAQIPVLKESDFGLLKSVPSLGPAFTMGLQKNTLAGWLPNLDAEIQKAYSDNYESISQMDSDKFLEFVEWMSNGWKSMVVKKKIAEALRQKEWPQARATQDAVTLIANARAKLHPDMTVDNSEAGRARSILRAAKESQRLECQVYTRLGEGLLNNGLSEQDFQYLNAQMAEHEKDMGTNDLGQGKKDLAKLKSRVNALPPKNPIRASLTKKMGDKEYLATLHESIQNLPVTGLGSEELQALSDQAQSIGESLGYESKAAGEEIKLKENLSGLTTGSTLHKAFSKNLAAKEYVDALRDSAQNYYRAEKSPAVLTFLKDPSSDNLTDMSNEFFDAHQRPLVQQFRKVKNRLSDQKYRDGMFIKYVNALLTRDPKRVPDEIKGLKEEMADSWLIDVVKQGLAERAENENWTEENPGNFHDVVAKLVSPENVKKVLEARAKASKGCVTLLNGNCPNPSQEIDYQLASLRRDPFFKAISLIDKLGVENKNKLLLQPTNEPFLDDLRKGAENFELLTTHNEKLADQMAKLNDAMKKWSKSPNSTESQLVYTLKEKLEAARLAAITDLHENFEGKGDFKVDEATARFEKQSDFLVTAKALEQSVEDIRAVMSMLENLDDLEKIPPGEERDQQVADWKPNFNLALQAAIHLQSTMPSASLSLKLNRLKEANKKYAFTTPAKTGSSITTEDAQNVEQLIKAPPKTPIKEVH